MAIRYLKTNHTILNWTLNEEKKMRLNKVITFKNFFFKIKNHKKSLVNILKKINKNNKKIIGYGASTKGNVILQFCKINSDLLPCVAEVNKFKFKKYTPGSKIRIVSERIIKKINPDYMLVLPWHFKEFILKKEKKFLNNGGKLIFPMPEVEIY
jgi:ABC-type Fe3+-citrate transport system substrate-binding protein